MNGGLADDVGRQESGKKLVRFLARDALSEQHEHRVGTSDSTQHHVGVAHVDVVCQTGGIAVSGLDYRDVARIVKRHKPDLRTACKSLLPFHEHRVLQFVAVGDDIHVFARIVSHFRHLQCLQVARQGGLRHLDTMLLQQFGKLVLASDAVLFY